MRRAIGLVITLTWCALGFSAAAEPAEVHVYKSPRCGCCSKWVDHLRSHGFSVTETNVDDVVPIKRENGIPEKLSSCHTALVDGYVVEGHVPAADLTRLLEERPEIAGIAVPGMPIGSPGMEGPNPERYQVLSFGGDGVGVFSEHAPE